MNQAVTALSPEARAGLALCPKCGRRVGILRSLDGTKLKCSTCGTAWSIVPKAAKKK